ncbi:phosphatidyl inositol 3-kinase-like protein [Lasiosphaeris hirsuta]|uniref:Serine/threonine-protein kinase MEC1 n=1 Tax=Lasiosphaeris hirsuta TaxID=260670 RepID=A0AA40B9A7_9PEZI|nr:phosphatidyl inositol 3-kinase-like protein [Lasiosphaeris hirsuta]
MAPESYGKAAWPGQQGLANPAAQTEPPPSTLAAQLVEGISTSARSSRPDETSELKRLFSAIERVKIDPTFLKTDDDRVEHNHLLIYVCGGVVLDGLKWEDPCSDKSKQRQEALKAITFLNVTIKETPIVLKSATDGTEFLFRGQEPLWIWILPRILGLLGHRKCLDLSAAIEGLCRHIFLLTTQNSSLWDLGPSLMQYFKTNFTAILARVKGNEAASSVNVELPPRSVLQAFSEVAPQKCTYTLNCIEDAVRHAAGLLAIIKGAALSKPGPHSQPSLLFGHHSVWLWDSLQKLVALQTPWPAHIDIGLASTLQMALDLATAQHGLGGLGFIVSQKANTGLAIICSGIFDQPQQLLSEEENGVALRRVACHAAMHLAKQTLAHRPLSTLVASRLIITALQVTSQNAIVGNDTDIGRSILLLKQTTASQHPVHFTEEVMSENFADELLREKVKNLHLEVIDERPNRSAVKRRKVAHDESHLSQIMSELCLLVASVAPDEICTPAALKRLIPDVFALLDEDRQFRTVDLLTRIPCAADATLKLTQEEPDMPIQFQCSFCSGINSQTPSADCTEPVAKEYAFDIFGELIQHPGFREARRPRIFAMVALRRLAKHTEVPDFLDLEKSGSGQWCLQSLQSSARELRIAAGRALGVFLAERAAPPFNKDTTKRSRTLALTMLKTISDRDVPHLNETCIMAWGQLGRIVADEELNLVLIKLVEYLGNRNMIVSASAYNEILNLAGALGIMPRRLFQPFWTSLAFTVVKDVVSKPQTTSRVTELLQATGGVPELLRLLQTFALPWLVLTKRREAVQKIAEARGEAETWQPCLDTANLPSIISLLLIQDVQDVAEYSMSLLRHTSPHFDGFQLVELLRTDPLLIALELFKAAADGDEIRKNRVRAALTTMSTLLSDSKDKKARKSHVTGRYLQQHALGLAARLSEVINDSLDLHPPVLERRRCLRAMEVMIRVCHTYVCIARPQISACLISALGSEELRSAAFSCWEAMIANMEEVDVEALIEMTFFIICHYWETFDEESRLRADSLTKFLMQKYERVLKDCAYRLPSLNHIEDLADFNKKLNILRPPLDHGETFAIFAQRLSHENPGVVQQALVELLVFLRDHQDYLQVSAISEQPDSVLLTLTRSLLDCSSKYNGWQPDIARLCAECIGLIGCLDSNRLETTREQQQFVIIHNFGEASETTDFVAFLLENVLVKAFLSTTDTKFQGFLSFAMQELLDRTDFKVACSTGGHGAAEPLFRKWLAMSDNTREVLTPFLSSRFGVAPLPQQETEYPIFRGGTGKSYANWIRALVLDLLRNGQNVFSQIVFEPLCRLVKVQDLSVTEFLLPFVVLHVIIGQENSSEFRDKITNELTDILTYQPPETASYVEREEMKLYYEAVFRIIDYFMRWLQKKKSQPGLSPQGQKWIGWVEGVLSALDPELIAQRAMDCKEYARALFFLEPYIESKRTGDDPNVSMSKLLATVQEIYTQIDDPDGLEGVSAQIQSFSLDQQALSHRKAGRWTAAQTWYEVVLESDPENVDFQLDFLTCLKESGQHDVLLNYVEGMRTNATTINRIAPYAVEASWATNRWQTLEKYLRLYNTGDVSEVFNLGIGQALLSLKDGNIGKFKDHIKMLREKVAGSMSYATTSSLRACHDLMLRCHVLADLEMIISAEPQGYGHQKALLSALERRLEVLGAYVDDKQYLLGVRRAAMELMKPKFRDQDIASLWLSTARLARKAGSMHQSFNAVLHAQQLGDYSAIIENARLLYKDGHHRKAIQVLQLAIETNSFMNLNVNILSPSSSRDPEALRNLHTARAHLLLAKWLDSTGQTHASALRSKFQKAAKAYPQWEKGHYYLGRHYKKVLESEKALKPDDQTDEYLSGETAKLVIENYLRSLNYGTKYLYQTLPRILTLWLELGAQVDKPPEGKVSLSRELHTRRKVILHELHKHFQKHLPRMPAFIFYTALPQIVARIAHPNLEVFEVLQQMIVKVVESHPRQSLWSLFSFMTTRTNSERRNRGLQILHTVRSIGKKVEGVSYDLKQLLRMGEKLAEQLLLACNNGDFQSNRTTTASITKDLNFNHKCTPCPLVVPIETCLTATLPTLTDNVKKHKAFSRDVITVESFLDQVLVLGSLAKPRKLTARGSNGKLYGLLIKPKDDLRTDQRLMEFNGLINRSLKRDAGASRRQLYIRTYAVTPLNEECGIIEWVDGLKTLRDILLGIYKTRGIAPNYSHIAQLMKEASLSEENASIFTTTVLGMFPPILSDWFISQFPNPSAWFAARLKYTRSCAVMSMVGTILGLGDRHGENVLLEEGNGGIFHVDFNCLFDKGLTFAQPERVPFRLTHNMERAMGIYRYEGPFRHCSELTLQVLRQQEETLMTILEAFIYDPTLDLQRSKKRNHEVVKLNPTSVVESIKRKVRGLLPEESIPLGVEGQVEELIKQAVDPKNLAAMYIGWCPFL